MRRSTIVALLTTGALAVAPAAADAAGFVAHLKTPGSHPKANKFWNITVTAKSKSGKPLRATAFYEFYFQGQKVSTQYPAPGRKQPGTAHKPYHFTGRYSDQILWPRRSVGIPLVFRVVVKVKGKGTVNLDKKVRVVK